MRLNNRLEQLEQIAAPKDNSRMLVFTDEAHMKRAFAAQPELADQKHKFVIFTGVPRERTI